MSHDRGVATKAETHRAARWQGAGRGGRGAEPPSMVKARYHRSTGLRPPALRMSSSTPLSLTPLPPPPASVAAALDLGLGRGSSGSVVRCGHLDGRSLRRRGQLMDLAIDGGHIADRGGRLRVSGIVAQPQGMGARLPSRVEPS